MTGSTGPSSTNEGLPGVFDDFTGDVHVVDHTSTLGDFMDTEALEEVVGTRDTTYATGNVAYKGRSAGHGFIVYGQRDTEDE